MRAFGADARLIPSPEGITPAAHPRDAARGRARSPPRSTATRPTSSTTTTWSTGYRGARGRAARQLDGRIDAWIDYVGTAGCFLGVTARAARARIPDVRSGRSSSRRSRRCSPAGRPARTGSRAAASASSRRCSTSTAIRRASRSVSTADAFAMARAPRARRVSGPVRRPARTSSARSGSRGGSGRGTGSPRSRRLRAEVPRRRPLPVTSPTGRRPPARRARGVADRPRMAALLGAICIAFSGVFYRWAEVSPRPARSSGRCSGCRCSASSPGSSIGATAGCRAGPSGSR